MAKHICKCGGEDRMKLHGDVTSGHISFTDYETLLVSSDVGCLMIQGISKSEAVKKVAKFFHISERTVWNWLGEHKDINLEELHKRVLKNDPCTDVWKYEHYNDGCCSDAK